MVDTWGGRSTTLRLLQSAAEDEDKEALVQVHYLKVQPKSPEFVSKYDGIDQNIKIELSTFIFSASPRPVIALYDFIMATFVSNHNALPSDAATPMSEASAGDAVGDSTNMQVPETTATPGKIRLILGLTGVKCMCMCAVDCDPTNDHVAW